ncbi:tryptophan-rich sensory protein [Leuconostoc carnosum]|uniref:TspO/MBR family protein n=1 Tax=Leuconostoc TaxID=1243 RepID=UPI000D525150|nr:MULTISPECIES: TspO/MBR family protein [Leuconostoc]KAA8324791.1 tryptophan-rich sensory protein [Leuconostoc carnosum]KAA8358728.1 tryptophan-rich sensory protein [Leuconostoc carnosum]KAA8364898.1 tryptophan-rich sensory protein [Leuconostoc carnosum]KAA8366440.1 tryptophan-rich sensory protein [Leuconostoc carnosum]KAA8371823.1 tryptophan-rich sensory protein [Leuconostoc carnosum]
MKKISMPIRAILFTLVIFLLGALSSFSVEWIRGVSIGEVYGTFRLPPFAPPRWLFGPAWGFLYILLGIYCANLNSVKKNRTMIYSFMYIQLILNIFWTVVFFSFANLFWASVMIVVMDILVFGLLLADHRRIRYILIPYLVWLLFASYLSIAVLLLN